MRRPTRCLFLSLALVGVTTLEGEGVRTDLVSWVGWTSPSGSGGDCSGTPVGFVVQGMSWPTYGRYWCTSGNQGILEAAPNPLQINSLAECGMFIKWCEPTFGGPVNGEDSEGPYAEASATMNAVDPVFCSPIFTGIARSRTFSVFDTDGVCQKRDDDSDGYSPEDEYPYWDCDDTDSGINPGVVPTCDSGLGQDFNCDGIEDLSQCQSPVVIDLAGDGFHLTDVTGGVMLDLNGDGVREQLPWTAAGTDDAWLVLDINGNGVIDGGQELFGNFSPQPPSEDPNGFRALAVFDGHDAGGNGDGWIDQGDAAFSQLRLWNDLNHDGRSEGELRTLSKAGVRRIALDYRESQRRDQWGNWFRYRAMVLDVKHQHIGQWAYDVFLAAGPRHGTPRK